MQNPHLPDGTTDAMIDEHMTGSDVEIDEGEVKYEIIENLSDEVIKDLAKTYEKYDEENGDSIETMSTKELKKLFYDDENFAEVIETTYDDEDYETWRKTTLKDMGIEEEN